jgi:5-formyltetrahydrofolate cyclo-ligase
VVFDKRARLPLDPKLKHLRDQALLAALCMSAPCRKPYLPQAVPPVALVGGAHAPTGIAARRAELRRAARRRRVALGAAARRRAARQILLHVMRQPWMRRGTAVALYCAAGSEFDPTALRARAVRRGCRVYLPRLVDHRDCRMLMCPDTGGRLQPNRLGIGEPPAHGAIAPAALDVVLLPLSAFDAAGTRLGAGAGYYDRLLAFRHGRRGAPLLVGLAFDCQRSEAIPAATHDVPLDAVITERGLMDFHANGRGRARR